MNRRGFISSLGVGIAAAMLPFLRPIPKPEIQWHSNIGVYEMLKQCERHVDLQPGPLDLKVFMEQLYQLKRSRPDPPDEIVLLIPRLIPYSSEELLNIRFND